MRCALLLLTVVLLSPLARAEIYDPGRRARVVGSDLLGLEFTKAVYEFTVRNRFDVALALDGSRPGLQQLRAGRAELALLMLPAEEEVACEDFERFALGYHCVFVVARADCPLESVTLGQLAGVFGTDGPQIARWSELELKGEWGTSRVVPLAPAPGSGVGLELFRHVVLGERALKSEVVHYKDAADLARHLAGTSRPLALATVRPDERHKVKLLAVTRGPQSAAFLPTPENLHTGNYPLRLPLRAFFRRDTAARAPAVRGLLKFMLGVDAIGPLARAHVIPAAPRLRAEQLAALEKM
jgi:phosphate transport system substrate-binding protein